MKTVMFQDVQQNLLVPELDPKSVALSVVDAVIFNKPRLFLPITTNATFLAKLLPTQLEDFGLKLFGITDAMKGFKQIPNPPVQ